MFGVLCSYLVFGAMGWFVNVTFMPTVIAATTDHGWGIVGVVVMLCILSFIHYQLAMRSFGLITQIPDRVTRWFGQGGENLGEEHEAKTAVGFMAANISRRADGISTIANGMMNTGGLNGTAGIGGPGMGAGGPRPPGPPGGPTPPGGAPRGPQGRPGGGGPGGPVA